MRHKKGGKLKLLLAMAIIFGLITYWFYTPGKAKADTTTGLVAYYTFDDVTGSTVPDSTSNNYDGEIQGGAAVATGKVGNGMSFDGVDGRINIPYQLLETQEPTFSYSFYVKADLDGGDGQFLLGQSASGVGVHFCQSLVYDHSTTTLKVLPSNFTSDFVATRDVDLTQWTHVAVTNSEAEGKSVLYINGVGVNSDDSSCPQALAAQFMLGRAPWDGFNMEFKGLLDEVRVYNRSLSASDVYELATEGADSTINISTPADNSTVHGSTNIQVTTGGSVAVTSVQYYLDGVALGSAQTVAPYTYVWDPSTVDQGSYTLTAVATNADGDQVPSQNITVTVDNDPTVRAVNTKNLQQTTSRIAWVTSEPASGQVEYGLTTSYGSTTTLDSTRDQYHNHALAGLAPNTTYHYRVTSVDASGYSVTSSDQTFTTLDDHDGNEWHVTTTGSSSGDGSIDNPWDLGTVMAQPISVQPGDTIWIHGGTYNGLFTSEIDGTPTRPIIIRNYNNERAIIDSGTNAFNALQINGTDTWWWGLEVMSSNANRLAPDNDNEPSDRATGMEVFGARTRLINNVIHDTAQGVGFWNGVTNGELYGNIIYYNGWQKLDEGGAGHGIYTQNNTGLKNIENNFVFGNFNFGFHAYTEGSTINNLWVEGNSIFNNGQLSGAYITNLLVGGLQIALNPVIINNSTFMPQSGGTALDLGYTAGCNYASVANNYLPAARAARQLNSCPNTSINDNLFYGTVPSNYSIDHSDNTYASSAPSSTVASLRPNLYETDKTSLNIYNWTAASSVGVDLSTVLSSGDTYKIIDVQNYFGDPVASGTYSGGTVTVPMTGNTVTTAVGNNLPASPTHTPSEFGTFLVVKTGETPPEDPPDNGGDNGGNGGSGGSGSVDLGDVVKDALAKAFSKISRAYQSPPPSAAITLPQTANQSPPAQTNDPTYSPSTPQAEAPTHWWVVALAMVLLVLGGAGIIFAVKKPANHHNLYDG